MRRRCASVISEGARNSWTVQRAKWIMREGGVVAVGIGNDNSGIWFGIRNVSLTLLPSPGIGATS